MKLCADRLRKRARTQPFDDAADAPDTTAGVVANIHQSQRQTALEDALQQLPERQRLSVILRHIQDSPDPESAEPLVWALRDANRRALREALPRISREDRRTRFEAILNALREDPFKPELLRALLSRQRTLSADRTERAEAIIVKRLSRMSPEDRTAYADLLEKGVRKELPRR